MLFKSYDYQTLDSNYLMIYIFRLYVLKVRLYPSRRNLVHVNSENLSKDKRRNILDRQTAIQ
jgi:hypothetical protein